MKATLGIVSNEGIVPVSSYFDTGGPMSTNVTVVADRLSVLVEPKKTEIPNEDMLQPCAGRKVERIFDLALLISKNGTTTLSCKSLDLRPSNKS